MNQDEYERSQTDAGEETLTVQQINQLPDKGAIPAFKGILKKLEPRKGKTSRRHFYIGFMTDHTGRIRVTFFRDDVEELPGELLKITADYQGKGIRKDSYKNKTEMTVFCDATIEILEPSQEENQQQVNKAIQDSRQPVLENPAIGMAANYSSRIISALVSNPEFKEPVQWLYSEDLTQIIDRLMTVYIDALHNRQ